jgi:hypothetical protein
LTLEEFDDWCKATDRIQAISEAADEPGGPRLSLVPAPEQNIAWPTDLLPPAEVEAGDAPMAVLPFDGLPLEDSRKRLAGWSADRQRIFLSHLAETGSVHLASSAARLTARSAYRLRVRSPAFASAWDVAKRLAVGRLSALAFDRAINGRTEQVWHDGALVAEKRMPSDKLLMWLLARLDPKRYGAPWEQRADTNADPQAEARTAFAGQLDALTDTPS